MFVKAFLPAPGGGPGQAEASGAIHLGDHVLHVAGTSCLGMDHAHVLELIKNTPRPVAIGFMHLDELKRREDEAAATLEREAVVEFKAGASLGPFVPLGVAPPAPPLVRPI